jgi:hypothetical protein
LTRTQHTWATSSLVPCCWKRFNSIVLSLLFFEREKKGQEVFTVLKSSLVVFFFFFLACHPFPRKPHHQAFGCDGVESPRRPVFTGVRQRGRVSGKVYGKT